MTNIRVRFAPSPTGQLHIGGARTALFNWLFARQKSGTMVLRIDDTDKERSQDLFLDQIIGTLQWLGLDWDEGPNCGGDYGPYIQSKRLYLYRKEASRLLEEGKAFFCFCDREKLEKEKEKARAEGKTPMYPGFCRQLSKESHDKLRAEGLNPSLRLKVAVEGTTVVRDLVRGDVSFDNEGIDDFIIMKSDFTPTYNFASTVDDLFMKISHVIRAEEHLSNTPRQILIAQALGYGLPFFAHVPMILAPDRAKLSKRHGATSVEEFKDEGYLPEALVNYLGLLGWSPGSDREVISLEEMVKEFNLGKVQKNAAIYDMQKLTWLNSIYMRQMDLKRLTEIALPFFKKYHAVDTASKHDFKFMERVVSSLSERAKTLDEMGRSAPYFFQDDFSYDTQGVKKHFSKEGAVDILLKAVYKIDSLKEFNKEQLKKVIEEIKEEEDLSFSKINPLLRLALTGATGGPDLMEIADIIGKEKTSERIKRAVSYIKEKQL